MAFRNGPKRGEVFMFRKNLFFIVLNLLEWETVSLEAMQVEADLKHDYAAVMHYETNDITKNEKAKEIYQSAITKNDTLLKVTKHLVANGTSPHAITAGELISLDRFPKKFVWMLYPEDGMKATADTVLFIQNLYSIKDVTKTIDLVLYYLTEGKLSEEHIGNVSVALKSLTDLCSRYTSLVDKQLNINSDVENLRNAIYNFVVSDETKDKTESSEDKQIFIKNMDWGTLQLNNVTKEKLSKVRNVLIDKDCAPIFQAEIEIPIDRCVFFANISSKIDNFMTKYLVPCIREYAEQLKDSQGFCVGKRKIDIKQEKYTGFSIQKNFYGKEFVEYLNTCRGCLASKKNPTIQIVTGQDLLKVNVNGKEDERKIPEKKTVIQACFKALTPKMSQNDKNNTYMFRIEKCEAPRVVLEEPYLATFFPSK